MTAATWRTAADGDAAATRPGDLAALGDHLGECQARRGPLFNLRCGSDLLGGFVAARLMTSLLLVSLLLIAGISWVG